MLHFAVSTVFLIFLSGTAVACPNDWVQFEESCYVFVDEMVPWTSAYTVCRILGGKMVEIESKDENDFITAQLQMRSGLDNVWLGLQDFLREGVFVWTSSFEIAEYTNWRPGEPNNDPDREGGQDCAWLRGSDGTWDDAWCESTYLHGPKIGVACETRASGGSVIG